MQTMKPYRVGFSVGTRETFVFAASPEAAAIRAAGANPTNGEPVEVYELQNLREPTGSYKGTFEVRAERKPGWKKIFNEQ